MLDPDPSTTSWPNSPTRPATRPSAPSCAFSKRRGISATRRTAPDTSIILSNLARRWAREALYQLMETFFGGRPEQIVNTLLNDEERRLSDEGSGTTLRDDRGGTSER